MSGGTYQKCPYCQQRTVTKTVRGAGRTITGTVTLDCRLVTRPTRHQVYDLAPDSNHEVLIAGGEPNTGPLRYIAHTDICTQQPPGLPLQ